MKRKKLLVLLLVISLTLTGCIKYNVTMDIKKDKSMDLSMIVAVDKSLMESSDDSSLMEEKDIKELKKKGFEVKEYNKDNMIGYEVYKTYKNIDYISKEIGPKSLAKEYDFSKLTEDKKDDDDDKMFSVQKGFFKNKYTAKLKLNTEDLAEEGTETFDDDDTSLREDTDMSDFSDLTNMTKNMDMTFTIKLPYKSLSNNATSTKNNDTELNWDLTKELESGSIDFQFELYNYSYIIIAIGLGIIIVFASITKLVNRKPKQVYTSTYNGPNRPVTTDTKMNIEKEEITKVKSEETKKEETEQTEENKESSALEDFYKNT